MAQHEQAQRESEQIIANLRIALGEAVKVPMLQKHISQLEGLLVFYQRKIAKLEAGAAQVANSKPYNPISPAFPP